MRPPIQHTTIRRSDDPDPNSNSRNLHGGCSGRIHIVGRAIQFGQMPPDTLVATIARNRRNVATKIPVARERASMKRARLPQQRDRDDPTIKSDLQSSPDLKRQSDPQNTGVSN
jgi:hypothetical protein